MTFSQVQWIGRFAKPENAFHEFVKKLYLHTYPAMLDGNEIMGATAWWNIRPTNPKPHNDRVSYCTVDGVDYTPKDNLMKAIVYLLALSFGMSCLLTMAKQTPRLTQVMIGRGKSNQTKRVQKSLLRKLY